MTNSIKYSTGSESLALKKGNFYIGTGDVGKGPTSTTGYYNGITPPSGGYTIYLNKATGGPSIYTCSNDTELVSLTNSIAGTSYTTANECLVYFAGQTDKMVLNRNYEGIVTDELVLNFDAGFTASYPKNGTTWFDIGSGYNGTLINGPSYNSSVGGNIEFDGTNDYVNIGVIDNTSNISFFGWAKNNGSFVTWNSIISKDGGTTGNRVYQINLHNGKLECHLLAGSSAYYIAAPNTVVNGEWFSFGLTSESGVGAKLYLNNQIVATSTDEIPANTSNRVTQLHTYYNGIISGGLSIAQCLMYNKTLTEEEMSINYNSTKGRFGL